MTARAAVVEQLLRIEEGGAFVGLLSVDDELDTRDRRFMTEIVAGVTRQRRWLDFVIDAYSRRPVKKMEAALRQILRVGTYEILETATPEYAAVNESVELAKRLVRARAGRLVNAVLRRVVEHRNRLPEPMGSLAERMAIRHSHPTWMVERWLERLGESETRDLLCWNNARPAFALRVNHERRDRTDLVKELEAANVSVDLSVHLDDFIRVSSMQNVVRAGILSRGEAAVQDEAAGLVVRVLDPEPGETLLDCCAAPGGKLCYAAARMHNTGRIVAVETNEARLGLARKAAETLGVSNVTFVQGDATDLTSLFPEATFDRVLIDAPCTGHGVLAKRPDLRWRRRPEDIGTLSLLQDRLLASAAELVRPGGLLVYSTCTIEPEENEYRVDDFLVQHPEFEIESVVGLVPQSMLTARGFFATLPHRHGLDGGFAVRLRRQAPMASAA